MKEKIRLHERIANLSRWEYQQAGVELAQQLRQLRQFQIQQSRLSKEILDLNEEQLHSLHHDRLNVQHHESARQLAAELEEALVDWQGALNLQSAKVAELRRKLALARQRQRKTEDKHQQSIKVWQLERAKQESNELEGIYIGNLGRSK